MALVICATIFALVQSYRKLFFSRETRLDSVEQCMARITPNIIQATFIHSLRITHAD